MLDVLGLDFLPLMMGFATLFFSDYLWYRKIFFKNGQVIFLPASSLRKSEPKNA